MSNKTSGGMPPNFFKYLFWGLILVVPPEIVNVWKSSSVEVEDLLMRQVENKFFYHYSVKYDH